MKYLIPANKVEKLEKIISRYTKKGANIQFDIIGDAIGKGTLYVYDNRTHVASTYPIDVKCKEVIVSGQYRINDWRFLGTIQFTENGNIIRLAEPCFEGLVPERYLHTPMICEHCGTIRNRKDTYLIYNEKTNEFKQVGSTCLLEYTKGLDADECASIMSCLDKCMELGKLEYTESEFLGNGYDSTGCGMSRETVLPIAYAYVKQYGYQRMFNGTGTAQEILDMLWCGLRDEEMVKRYESLVMPSDKEVEVIDAYAKEHINDSNDYMRNASLAWLNSTWEYRDFGLVSSFVNTYLKETAKKAEIASRKNNEWVGNVGDRVTIKVKSARVLYTKDNSWCSYYAGCSYLMEIIDAEGHTFIWSASTNNINEGNTVVATIKNHDEFRGIRQTVITRGRVSL